MDLEDAVNEITSGGYMGHQFRHAWNPVGKLNFTSGIP
jgi:hypothetical protein